MLCSPLVMNSGDRPLETADQEENFGVFEMLHTNNIVETRHVASLSTNSILF
ncbi:hypothetical protein [Mastigocoleus sp. MO_188.B34]|uniref:hypothetical protein n=1 Tax=Mastigocoleus sp. MO_188.B34 TaxID=3036635 RepID=UPI00263620BE|nr:hypothetical protein [Mastigocoleus sp. MO_188.B34]